MLNLSISNSVKFNWEIYSEDINRLISIVFKMEKVNPSKFIELNLDISFVGNAKIKSMNSKYRRKDKATDVLSFPVDNIKTTAFPAASLGDIYVSIDKVKQQCKDYNHSFKRELLFLICHGLFHLLGYDHILEEDAKIMEKKQKKAMKKLGVKR